MRISDWSSDVCSSDLPFWYTRSSGRREVQRWYELPEDVLMDPDELQRWATDAIRIAATTKKPKRAKPAATAAKKPAAKPKTVTTSKPTAVKKTAASKRKKDARRAPCFHSTTRPPTGQATGREK